MFKPYCLNISGTYSLGDLNMWLSNVGDVTYPEMDHMHPEKPYFTGKIEEQVIVDGKERQFLEYIPSAFPISGAGLYIIPDSRVSCKEALTDSWIRISEKYQIALIVLESPKDGWSRENIQREVTYCEQVFKKSICRKYYSLNESTYYLIGLGEGAYVSTTYGLLNSSLFSCVLSDGAFELEKCLIAQLGTIQSDRDAQASKLDIMMPAWFVGTDKDSENSRVIEVYKKANQTSDICYFKDSTEVYLQDVTKFQHTIDGLPMGEVRYTCKGTLKNKDEYTLYDEMVSYAMHFKRWLAIGNGFFRPARTAEDMKLKRFTDVIDGYNREWYVYEPSCYATNPNKKLPVLLAIHGFSCTGKMFAENTEWQYIAEERDFFVVYVSALPSNITTNGTTVPLPTWNTPGMKGVTDDVKYIEKVLDWMKDRYPIDTERVYASGHSNGSMMTQVLMDKIPNRFAAFAPQGAPYHMDVSADLKATAERSMQKSDILRPVWLMMGEMDIGDQDKIEPGNLNDKFIEMICYINGLDRKEVSRSENGNYHTETYFADNGMPLLKFTGIKNAPHSISPEMCLMYWDQFLSHFRRKKDGSLEYIK